jgi:hypothetical protein
MAGVVIEIPDAAYKRALAALDPAQLRQALFQTVKRTTNKGRTIARKEIQKVLNLKSEYVNEAITTQLDIRDPDPPLGIVRISRRRLPAFAFNPKVTAGGVSVRMWKDKPTLQFRHAFLAVVNQGNAKGDAAKMHTGIFFRTRHLPTKGPNQKRGKLTPQGFAGRLAMKELTMPSVESAAEVVKVAEAIYKGIEGEAEKVLNSQIDRFTK